MSLRSIVILAVAAGHILPLSLTDTVTSTGVSITKPLAVVVVPVDVVYLLLRI